MSIRLMILFFQDIYEDKAVFMPPRKGFVRLFDGECNRQKSNFCYLLDCLEFYCLHLHIIDLYTLPTAFGRNRKSDKPMFSCVISHHNAKRQ